MSATVNYNFLDSHEWVDLSSTPSPFGISDFAQNELTDIVYVELPEVGQEVSAGDVIAVVESVKSASDIYAPVSGTVVEVNEALEGEPALINTAAFTDGWIAKIEASGTNDALLSDEEYAKHIG